MSIVAITDYITNPDIEKNILGELVGFDIGKETKVLMVWHQKIDANILNSAPNLVGIQRYGVGYDNVDLELLKSKNIIFCNNPDYCVDEVSDTAVGMIIGITRGIFKYNAISKKYFENWQENILHNIRRTSFITVGIIGAGRIGGKVILKLRSLGFKTVFYDKYKENGWEKVLGSERVYRLDDLLEISDIISLHVPLNDETSGMVDENFLKKMKLGSSIVNTARGKLIKDLDIIYDYLVKNKLDSFCVDVLPEEPPIHGKLIEDWRNNKCLEGRIIINPHTSFYSKESFIEMREKAAKNVLRMLQSKNPLNRIV
ncbi:MAG: NAD(P)-dependent oxidoreductase [Candidatus Woesearchaeota archaeon]